MRRHENKRNCPKSDMAAMRSESAETASEAAENRQAARALLRESSEYSRNERAISSKALFCDSSADKACMNAGSSSSVRGVKSGVFSDSNSSGTKCLRGKSKSGVFGTPRRKKSENPFGKPLSDSFLTFSIVIFALSVICLVLVIAGAITGNAVLLILAALPTPLLVAYSVMGMVMAKYPL